MDKLKLKPHQPDPDDYFEDYRETRRCGDCSHFDELNQCCWVISHDGICRDCEQDDYCHLGYKEE